MIIMKTGSTPSLNAPQDYFTGTVRQDSMFVAPAPSKLSLGLVTFEPGARTAWHTHPYGQMIIITAGKGWVQKEGEAHQVVTAGDVVFFEAGERHWHGAAEDTAMSHYAIQESKDGSPVTWEEKVSDHDYQS
ncbi:hypothetical protein AHYW_003723 [Providencia manganoxydans]|uniref:(R)-mandelonitrile lyase n=1 Tax=Providencia TaxID=586 RepID=UPI0018E401BE|nr:cupin domain-containing protein [Providencia rettgeri]MBI6191127.1 cupin domain-containing protein [Providencia rettgeri]